MTRRDRRAVMGAFAVLLALLPMWRVSQLVIGAAL